MRQQFLAIVFVFIGFTVEGKLYAQTKKYDRDSLLYYSFIDTSLSVSLFPNITPLTPTSFKSKYFKVDWINVYTKDINAFILRSIRNVTITDTLSFILFDKKVTGIEYKVKKKYYLITYQPELYRQNVFIISNYRHRKLSNRIKLLETATTTVQ